jgi:hypothetical protein
VHRLYANITPLSIRDWSICNLGICGSSWNQFSTLPPTPVPRPMEDCISVEHQPGCSTARARGISLFLWCWGSELHTEGQHWATTELYPQPGIWLLCTTLGWQIWHRKTTLNRAASVQWGPGRNPAEPHGRINPELFTDTKDPPECSEKSLVGLVYRGKRDEGTVVSDSSHSPAD